MGLGLFSADRLGSVNGSTKELARHWLPTATVLGDISHNFEVFRSRQGQTLLLEGEQRQSYIGRQAQSIENIERDIKAYEPLISRDEERRLADAVISNIGAYMEMHPKYVELLQANDIEGATQYYIVDMRDSTDAVREAIAAARAYQVVTGTEVADEAVALGDNARLLIFIALAMSSVACMIIGFIMVKSISAPIGKMADTMRVLSAGNTEVRIPNLGEPNEIGNMAAAVEVFKEGMIRTRALEIEAVKAREDSEYQRKQAMHQLAD